VEAIFLLRAYRTTLPRFGYTVPLDTQAMQWSGAFRPRSRTSRADRCSGTYDYTQRLLDFSLLAEGGPRACNTDNQERVCIELERKQEAMPRVLALLDKEGLIAQEKIAPRRRRTRRSLA